MTESGERAPTDPWARFRHRPATGATRAGDEHRSYAETSRVWITASWWLHGAFVAAVALFALGDGDLAQWRWIIGPLTMATGAFTVVRPQASYVVDPRHWFRDGEPSRTDLRWERTAGVLLLVAGLFVLVAQLLWPDAYV